MKFPATFLYFSYIDSLESVCLLPKKPGPGEKICLAYFPRFFYNKTSNQCEKFIYGGCGGNANNFENLEDCSKLCEKGKHSGRYIYRDAIRVDSVHIRDMLHFIHISLIHLPPLFFF